MWQVDNMAFATPVPCLRLRDSRMVRTLCARPMLRVRAVRQPARMSVDAGLAALDALGAAEGRLPGTVYLVGAGPGDGGLLTLRARELLARADVVLYDRLAGEDVLQHVRADATMVYVGKEAGYHTRTQREIHTLLAAFAALHGTVVRLKGGDPGVYGRGGEEMAYLRARGVSVEVVPGVTAGSAVAAALGFPLTLRGVADAVRFVTGHTRAGGAADELRHEQDTTLVLYMGLAQLPAILERLGEQGLEEDTPAVAVERATTPRQRAVWGVAGDLADRVKERGLQSPTLVIVGHVVALAQGWMDEMSGMKSVDVELEPPATLREEDRALLLESMRRRT